MSTSSRSVQPQLVLEASAELLVEIIAEGGPRLGFGHAGRCLALWEELGDSAAFQVHDDAVVCFLREQGAPIVSNSSAPLVVLDRAALVTEQEVGLLRAEGRRVVLIDDLGPARMQADVVLDPPTAAVWPPAAGVRLAGFEHVLLRREVREAAPARAAHGVDVATRAAGSVLLAMGGSDPTDLTPLLADVLSGAGIDVTVALGPGYRGSFPITSPLPVGREGFVSALASADLLVAGYGHSLLEAAHLGVPAIAVVYRSEQLPHAAAFCRQGTAELLDLTTRSNSPQLAAATGRLLLAPERRAEMSARGQELVDGRGAERIAKTLLAMA